MLREWCITKPLWHWEIIKGLLLENPSSCRYRYLSITKTTWAKLPMSLKGYELQLDPCHHCRLTLEEFINGFYDVISTLRAPVTIWPLSLLSYTMSRCRMHLGLRRFLPPSTQCQWLRLSLHLQVLVPPVPLLSSITIAILACDIANPFLPDLGVRCMDLVIDLIYELVYIKNLFPPDLWGYVYGFGHHPECLIASLWHYDPLKF